MQRNIGHGSRLILRQCRRRSFSSSSVSSLAYGFIGLGRMGLPMAQNLRAKIDPRDSFSVFDVNSKATDEFMSSLQNGDTSAVVAKSVREVAEQSDIVITSLPEPPHVDSVFKAILDPVLHVRNPDAPPRLFIDVSTIDPITSRRIAKTVAETTKGEAAFVDAPMSGGVVGAKAATLTFMLGCPESQVSRATEVLQKMGRRIVHLGDQGAGLAGKLANNYLLALNNIATAEAMAMGIQWGLDPKALAGLINSATGRCWPSEVNNPVPGVIEGAPAGRGYEGGFGISLMRKDLGLAMDSAEEFGVKNLLGKDALKVYKDAEKDERCKGLDFSSVYRLLEKTK